TSSVGADGLPDVRVEYTLSANSRRILDFGLDRAEEMLRAAGAHRVTRVPLAPLTGWHLLGTARMGTDPATSVVDDRGRCHAVPSRGRGRADAVFHAIADAARGEDAFVRADAAGRISSVKRVEAEMGEPFRAFVSLLLQDYYETDAVLVAIGSRAEPPQPDGHV